MTTPVVDVVVPVHNRWHLTESCLEHLRAQTVAHNVIVCDNGSTDGTRDRLRALFPDVSVIELGANLGFSAACNRGVRAGSGEIIVLLNNDVDCHARFLERLTAPLQRDRHVGSVAALLLMPGEEQIESFGLTLDSTLSAFPRLRGASVEAAQAVTPVLLGPAGAAGAYRRKAWEAVGGLDEGVTWYAEDVDLAMQFRAAGWSAAAAREAVGVHVGSATAGQRSAWQRHRAGFSRGYFLRRYGVLRSSAAPRTLLTELVVMLGDALVFSHDLAALRGRVEGWRAARGSRRKPRPPQQAIDHCISFLDSLRLRIDVYTGRLPTKS